MRKRRPEKDAGVSESTRPFWSGTITFGLVSVPVDLYPANREDRVSLRMIGPEGQPLRREYHPEKGERALGKEDLVRGYEYAKGKFIVVTDEELERLAPEKTRDIELQRFVPASEIDPLYFERGYFLAPSGPSRKAYDLLAESMAASDRAGIATFVMRGKEYLVAILSENGILRAETLRFADELRPRTALGLSKKPKVEAAKVRAFEKLIARSTKRRLETKLLEDRQAEKIEKLARRKKASHKDVIEIEAPAEEGAQVIDLMDVLKKSLSAPGSSRRSSSTRATRKKKKAA